MKQKYTLSDASLSPLLAFIDPASAVFPPWPGNVDRLLSYEQGVRRQKIDAEVGWTVRRLSYGDIMDFASRLKTDLNRCCPAMLDVLVGRRHVVDLPADIYRMFPLEDIYRRWAKFCRWPKFLNRLEVLGRECGLVHYPFPRTYAGASGLKVDWSDLRLLYSGISDIDFSMREPILEIVSKVLPYKNLPICFKFPGMVPAHPWVALLCETLRLVGELLRGITPTLEMQRYTVAQVANAFAYDSLEFAWRPRVPYQFSPGVTQKLWFEQVARLMTYEPIDDDYGYVVGTPAESIARMQNHIETGIRKYHQLIANEGLALDTVDRWMQSVTKYTMSHVAEPTPEVSFALGFGWVAEADQAIEDELNQEDDNDNDNGDDDHNQDD